MRIRRRIAHYAAWRRSSRCLALRRERWGCRLLGNEGRDLFCEPAFITGMVPRVREAQGNNGPPEST